MKRKDKEEKEKMKGEAAFSLYYSSIYGKRWLSLKAALLEEKNALKILNGDKEYFMDCASVFAACALPLEGDVLDMCAAPGGKSLILAKRLPHSARLLLNELSSARMQRLKNVTQNMLTAEERARLSYSCRDCLTLRGESLFSSILLDAPCSSERHVMKEAKYLDEWTQTRVKMLARKQFSLLKKGFSLLKNGGFLLYSTCSMSFEENDEAVSKILAKRKELISVVPDFLETRRAFSLFSSAKPPAFEKLKRGFIFLPDFSCGSGPLYFSLLKKISSSVQS